MNAHEDAYRAGFNATLEKLGYSIRVPGMAAASLEALTPNLGRVGGRIAWAPPKPSVQQVMNRMRYRHGSGRGPSSLTTVNPELVPTPSRAPVTAASVVEQQAAIPNKLRLKTPNAAGAAEAGTAPVTAANVAEVGAAGQAAAAPGAAAGEVSQQQIMQNALGGAGGAEAAGTLTQNNWLSSAAQTMSKHPWMSAAAMGAGGYGMGAMGGNQPRYNNTGYHYQGY